MRLSCYDRRVDRTPASKACSDAGKVVGPDVPGCVQVCVEPEPTLLAPELGLRLPVGLLTMTATAALLACVSWVHEGDAHASQFSLVAEERLEPVEGPRVQSAALEPPSLGTGADAGQVFQNNNCSLRNRIYDLFGQDMIAVPAEAFKPTAKAFQVPFCRLGAIRLKGTAEPKSTGRNLTPAPLAEEQRIGSDGRSDHAKIHADHGTGRHEGLLRGFDSDMKPESVLAIFNQFGGQRLPAQPVCVERRDGQHDMGTAPKGQDAGLAAHQIDLAGPGVVPDGAAGGLRTRRFLALGLQLAAGDQRLSGPNSGRHDQLGRQTRCCPLLIVGGVMKLNAVHPTLWVTNGADPVEGRGVEQDSGTKRCFCRCVGQDPGFDGQTTYGSYTTWDVVAVKGRKVPLGTKGECCWVGDGKFGRRCGVKDAAGTVWWTAISNIRIVEVVA